MVCGADSIDDMDPLRHGGMGRLFADVRPPSTLSTVHTRRRTCRSTTTPRPATATFRFLVRDRAGQFTAS